MKASTKGFIVTSIAIIVLLRFVTAVFHQLTDMPLRATGTIDHDDRQNRYIKGKEETITFFAREHENSDHMIARKATLIQRPGAEVTLFVFHGFMCNKNDIRFLVNSLFGQTFNKKPFNTVTIDFRAHGDATEGQCCSLGCNEMYDVMGIVEYIKAHPELKNTKRGVYGFSMGAVASILAQAKDPSLFDFAVWDCPFDKTENVLGCALERLKLSAFGYEFDMPCRSLLHKYFYNSYVQQILKVALKTIAKMDTTHVNTCIAPVNTVDAMKSITIPYMLIVCRNDEKVPVKAAQELYNAGNAYKRLWVTNGRNHFDSYFHNPEKYIYKVNRHIQKVLDGTYKKRPLEHITYDVKPTGILTDMDKQEQKTLSDATKI